MTLQPLAAPKHTTVVQELLALPNPLYHCGWYLAFTPHTTLLIIHR